MKKEITFGATIALLLSGFECAHADQSVYLLEQTHRELGRTNTYVSGRGFRLDNLPTKCTYVATAPTWMLTIYNGENKSFSQDLLSHWVTHAIRPNIAAQLDLSEGKLEAGKAVSFEGLRATEYKVVVPKQSDDEKRKRLKSFLSTLFSADYTVADRLGVPPQACAFLARYFNMPDTKGVPLRSQAVTKTNDRAATLATKKVGKQIVADDFFTPPQGFKHVKDESAVLMNASKLNALSELMTGQSVKP